MSTYSTTLRLELIGAGEQDGTWGDTTNNNLGDLLEAAITNVVNITFSDANYTLTAFNGLPDESRNAVLNLIGTNTVQRNLIAPAVEKTYIIKNSTGANVAITTGGANVVIPTGSTQHVWCDGTDFFASTIALGTGSTGTGNLVYSTSPTITTPTIASPNLTGTPVAPTATAGTNTTQIATTAFVNSAVTTATGSLGTMSTQNANAVAITGGTVTGITDLTVADGGTGRSTLTANAVLVGNGTSGINSISPSTSGNLLVSNGTVWTSTTLAASGVKLGLGITGETWSSPSRSGGTTYTNSNSYPIMVNVTVQLVSGPCGADLIVGGVTVYQYGIAGFFSIGSMVAIVPAGATYQVNLTGMQINGWAELS